MPDFSYSDDQLRELAQTVLDHARNKGATACETEFSEGFGQSVSVRRGKVDTLEHNRDKSVGVTVYLGQRKGFASSSDLSVDAIRATVESALDIARYTAEDEFSGLADPERLAREWPDLGLCFPWVLDVDAATDIARRCEQAAFDASPEIRNSEGASVSSQQAHFMAANSLGFMGGYASTRHYVACSVIAGKQDTMQRDDWYTTARDPADLESPESVGDFAAQRAVARLGARKIATCEVPVLFEAPLACGLIGQFVRAVSGGSLYRRASFLLDSQGDQVFAPCVSISERPHLLKGLASAPFDDDGVATLDREVVFEGTLQGYFLGTYSGRKLGLASTGNAGGPHNLIVQPGALDFDELVEQVGRGLLVTELMGQGVNMVTGDYSRGASGFWIENGEIQYPVEEITIAGNLRDMFRGIRAIGSDTLVRGAKQCGSILVDCMTVAGN